MDTQYICIQQRDSKINKKLVTTVRDYEYEQISGNKFMKKIHALFMTFLSFCIHSITTHSQSQNSNHMRVYFGIFFFYFYVLSAVV